MRHEYGNLQVYFNLAKLKNDWVGLKKVYTRKKRKGADASVPGRMVVRRHLICFKLRKGYWGLKDGW